MFSKRLKKAQQKDLQRKLNSNGDNEKNRERIQGRLDDLKR